MSESKPIVYILRGDDREEIESTLQGFFQRLGSPDMAEMNTSRLEGRSATLNDLRAAALALPFLTERRLVILEDALLPYTGRGTQDRRTAFTTLLDELPETTALVLVIPDSRQYKRGEFHWEVLDEKHWLVQWTRRAGRRALILDCNLPTDAEMVNWSRDKAGELGGSFSRPPLPLPITSAITPSAPPVRSKNS